MWFVESLKELVQFILCRLKILINNILIGKFYDRIMVVYDGKGIKISIEEGLFSIV